MNCLETTRHSGLVKIEIQRPEIHNAFNPQLIEELNQAFQNISSDDRVVLLCSQGDSFCAGADLNWMKSMVSYSIEENRQDSHRLFDMIYSIRTCPVPVIGKIQGPAIGGGAGLVSACDIALAGPRARFGFTEVRLGLLPAVISPFVMEKIGRAAASRYFLTGERFGPGEALRIGLIHQVCDYGEDLDDQVEKTIAKLMKNGPLAMRTSKKLILEWNGTLLEEKERVASLIAEARTGNEGQEGMNAFFEKRTPSFAKNS